MKKSAFETQNFAQKAEFFSDLFSLFSALSSLKFEAEKVSYNKSNLGWTLGRI